MRGGDCERKSRYTLIPPGTSTYEVRYTRCVDWIVTMATISQPPQYAGEDTSVARRTGVETSR